MKLYLRTLWVMLLLQPVYQCAGFGQVPTILPSGHAMDTASTNANGGQRNGPASILWNQSDYDTAHMAYPDQDTPDNPAMSSFLVEDFHTDGASWSISKISEWFTRSQGNWSQGVSNCDVQFYPKTGALPDNSFVPPGSFAPCVLNQTTDSWIVSTDTSSIAALQGICGQFWVGSTPIAELSVYGREYHYETIIGRDDHTAFINPGGGMGFGTTWTDVASIGVGGSYDCAIELDGIGNGTDFTCSTSGTCPTSVTVSWSGAPANSFLRIVYSKGLGCHVIPPSYPCAGLALGLDGNGITVYPKLTNTALSTGSGNDSVNLPAAMPGFYCGGYIQCVIEGSCAKSNTTQLPP